jgi:hypothetical protein
MIPYGEWLPDQAPLDNPGMTEALNVRPVFSGYAPIPALTAAMTEALTARCRGAYACRSAVGAAHLFAGDLTDLQKMESGGLTWDEVSRTAGGDYAADRWSFCNFGDRVLAVDGVDAMQSYVLGVSTDFVALGGSSPVPRYLTVVGPFVVAAGVVGNLSRVQWPAIDDPTDWVASALTQADYQDITDGGIITQIVGGAFGTILQQKSIKRMTYTGPPTIFQIEEILRDIGTDIPGSVAAYEGDLFFISDDGLHLLRGMLQLEHVGFGKFDDFFFDDVDQSYLDRVTSSIDPLSQCYYLAYPGSGHVGGTPNRGIIYNKRLGRAARFETNLESLFSAVQAATSYTLDGLDAISSSLDALAASLDSSIWTGEGRPFLAAFNTAHKLGLFSGASLAATFDSAEVQLVPGARAIATSCRPLVDTNSVSTLLGIRNLQSEAVTWSDASLMNEFGACPLLGEGRYHRLRTQIAAGVVWTLAQGVDGLEFSKGAAV